MKTSQLIKELQEHMNMWGDADISIYNEQKDEESEVVNVLAGVEDNVTKSITVVIKAK